MRINTNLNAMVATNQMAKNTALSGKSMEKLSTGLRITNEISNKRYGTSR